MYRLNELKISIYHTEEKFRQKVAKTIGVDVNDINWDTFTILHKSIDARDKNNICFVYNVAFDLTSSKSFKFRVKLQGYEKKEFDPIIKCDKKKEIRPIVVGFGPAGIFASYIFALNGYRPIVLERGKSIDDRILDTEKFFKTMELDENSNVCFGEGGAGAFSDGKLNTNNKDRDGLYHFVLETFVKFGADEKILYENLPHIGTDKLTHIIKNIRNEIIRLGGEIHYNTKLYFDKGIAKLTRTNEVANDVSSDKRFMEIATTIKDGAPVVLAIGNSSRDTFRDLIENGFDIRPKTFAVGYRIAHLQTMIDESKYGDSNLSHLLGSATYKLVYNVDDTHSVYSFCMCPGGYIINSSNFKNYLSVNGMSYNDRNGKYANSAIVETISPKDVLSIDSEESMTSKDALKMIEFQEMIEKKAFELEKGYIPYVTSGISDICREEVFKGQAKYCEKLKSVYEDCGLKFDINKDIEEALGHFNKIMKGFFDNVPSCTDKTTNEYIIAGVETRTSSPVKLDRDVDYMCNVPNFYPSGEGLGHGGGIMSSAVDGISVAMKIVQKMTTIYSGQETREKC